MSVVSLENINLAKDKSNLIKYVGGIGKAFEFLEILYQHRDCCEFWYMHNVYGKGKAKHNIVERKLHICTASSTYFTLDDLKTALSEYVAKSLAACGVQQKVAFISPLSPPEVVKGLSRSSLWEESQKLILKCFYHGEYQFITGKYKVSCYAGGSSRFTLDGHNGDWSDTVVGWAYL